MAREQALRLALAAALLLGLLAIWATSAPRAGTAPPTGGDLAVQLESGDREHGSGSGSGLQTASTG